MKQFYRKRGRGALRGDTEIGGYFPLCPGRNVRDQRSCGETADDCSAGDSREPGSDPPRRGRRGAGPCSLPARAPCALVNHSISTTSVPAEGGLGAPALGQRAPRATRHRGAWPRRGGFLSPSPATCAAPRPPRRKSRRLWLEAPQMSQPSPSLGYQAPLVPHPVPGTPGLSGPRARGAGRCPRQPAPASCWPHRAAAWGGPGVTLLSAAEVYKPHPPRASLCFLPNHQLASGASSVAAPAPWRTSGPGQLLPGGK